MIFFYISFFDISFQSKYIYRYFDHYLSDVRCPRVQQIKLHFFLNSSKLDFNLIKNKMKVALV